jgi:preprotein translocase subunit SecE
MEMAKVTPAQFVRQVRQEVSKVTWSTRKDTGIGTMMVFIMVALAAIFFALVDTVLSWGVQSVLGLGG